MLKIKSYVKVNSLAEAYELNQKKTARILGGMVWMKMGNRAISTAIDLSGLGLDAISENGRKHLWKIWFLRCSDHVPGNGYMGRII